MGFLVQYNNSLHKGNIFVFIIKSIFTVYVMVIGTTVPSLWLSV